MLLDDVLLETFDFCRKMHDYRRLWPRRHKWDWLILVHVCRRWRKIIFESPHRLNLRILCTNGSPVRTNLGIWPAFPIDLELRSPISLKPEDEENAIAALERRDRVNTVDLCALGSLLGKMAAVMQEPFLVLTRLCMYSKDQNTPVLTAAFLGGSAPHLQEITLYRIPFPALPTLLLSTSDLVTLNLFDIPTPGYISPERMVACLATLPRLDMLAIRFQPLSPRPDRIRPPPIARLVLPALTFLEFRGAFGYLEDLVAQIDCPHLEQVSIRYIDSSDGFQVTQLSEFIDRSIGPELTPSRHARVNLHSEQVAFTLTREYANYPGWDRRSVGTYISYEAFEWEMPDVARTLCRFSAALRTVVHLELDSLLDDDFYADGAYDIEWLDLLRQFPAMQMLHVSTGEIAEPVFIYWKTSRRSCSRKYCRLLA